MIQSFADAITEATFRGERAGVRRFGSAVARQAMKRLLLLHAADLLSDLMSPPGNRLEALAGDLTGLHSIRVNNQWRIVFRWTDRGPQDVQIVDYH